MQGKLLIGGKWLSGGGQAEVRNKYSGQPIGTAAVARREDAAAAVGAAESAAVVMADLPTHRRAAILARTAELLNQRRDELARVIAAEAGKALKFSRVEVDRAVSTFTFAGEEAKRIHGETVPLDAVPSGEGYLGFWLRRPVGVIVAITPFNFPLNLVVHKVAPAIAAGNAVVLKPASVTPLSAILLCEVLQEAGLPDGAINLVTGAGGTVGDWLVTDARVAKVTFTGSAAVGRQILARRASSGSAWNWATPRP